MSYLTETEFVELGFDKVQNFDNLEKKASAAIDLFINNFYESVSFETDFDIRKNAVKKAVAFQIGYMDSSGVMTAEDKTSLASMTIGRTSVSYQNGSNSNRIGQRYNLSLDAENWLRMAGFGYTGVNYDR
ncbi:phage protein [Streptococcus uberis]|uniref:hypothetical protein n=1 Tax=Streptococcus uberis TaxID=1349 RepID=UPI000DA3388E|nr:hypothetical protein [Streptococcus uberis]MCK1248863.1 hypothetical protein [Streptococcus uberis]SQG83703.1 phage protein [Streptococcus uberis]